MIVAFGHPIVYKAQMLLYNLLLTNIFLNYISYFYCLPITTWTFKNKILYYQLSL
jgi:hypothetical protein